MNLSYDALGKKVDDLCKKIEAKKERLAFFEDVLENSIDIYRKLEKQFQDTNVYRPMKIERYEDGTELEYDITGVSRAAEGRLRLYVDKFVGGGFAGQVYRVKVLKVESENGSFQAGRTVEPSSFPGRREPAGR